MAVARRSGDIGVEARDGRADGSEPRVETAAKRLRTSGDGEGNEHDEHGVFGSCGTALIAEKAIDQIEHLTVSLDKCSAALSPVNVTCDCRAADAQSNHLPSTHCSMGRQKTVNFIGF